MRANRFAKRSVNAATKTPSTAEAGASDPDFMDFPVTTKVAAKVVAVVDNRTKRQKLDSLMGESIEEGMKKPIDSSNKGFRLLSKFGYQPSTGLGKHESGIQAPVAAIHIGSINDISKRSGIGVRREEESKLDEQVEKMRQVNNGMIILGDEFRERQRNIQQCQLLRRYKFQCEKVIFDMDSRRRIKCHELWPVAERRRFCDDDKDNEVAVLLEDNDSKAELDDDLVSPEDLKKYVEYLRGHYYYCCFCGCQFDSEEDMESGCPGKYFEDH
jgi:hypothetical protein